MENIDLKLERLTTSHDIDTARVAAAFFAEDDIGMIIRCHFLLERAAIHALEVITDGRWKKNRSKYLGEKLEILAIIGAPPRILAPARTLNNLRNDFAHEGVEAITTQTEADLTRGVRAFYPKLTDDFGVSFTGSRTFTGRFGDCTPRQRYALAASVLTMFVGGIPELMKACQDEARGREVTDKGPQAPAGA